MYPINEEVWSEWEEWRRKELRKKITERAYKRQRNMLSQYPPEVQAQIMNHSMDNDYQGLFPEKVAKQIARPAIRPQSTRGTPLHHDLTDRSWAKS